MATVRIQFVFFFLPLFSYFESVAGVVIGGGGGGGSVIITRYWTPVHDALASYRLPHSSLNDDVEC